MSQSKATTALKQAPTTDSTLRWKSFMHNPSQTDGEEQSVFEPITDIWKGIIAAVQEIHPGRVPTLTHSQMPDFAQASEHPVFLLLITRRVALRKELVGKILWHRLNGRKQ